MDRSTKILILSGFDFLIGAVLMGIALFTDIDARDTFAMIGAMLMVISVCSIVIGTMVRVNEKEKKKKG